MYGRKLHTISLKKDLVKADEANHRRRARAHHRAASDDPIYQRNYFVWNQERGRFVFNLDGIPKDVKDIVQTEAEVAENEAEICTETID